MVVVARKRPAKSTAKAGEESHAADGNGQSSEAVADSHAAPAAEDSKGSHDAKAAVAATSATPGPASAAPAPSAAKEPKAAAEPYSRNGAQYVCNGCQKKYFTKDEVVSCFESHGTGAAQGTPS